MKLRPVIQMETIECVDSAILSTVERVDNLSAVVMEMLDHVRIVLLIILITEIHTRDAHHAVLVMMENIKPDFAMQVAKTANVQHVRPNAERASGKALLVPLQPTVFARIALCNIVLPDQAWLDVRGSVRAGVWRTLALRVIRWKDFLLQLTPLIIATYREIAVELRNALRLFSKVHQEVIPVFRGWDVARINTKMDAIP